MANERPGRSVERPESGGDLVRRPAGARPPMIQVGNSFVPVPKGEGVHIALPLVDICFVFDTTGSMSDKIAGLTASLTDLVQELGKLSLDWRTTCVPFGDLTVPGDRVVESLPFVKTVEAAQQQLRSLPRFSGGGNDGESAIEAMDAGLTKPWRQKAVKVLVLLTDEPALHADRDAARVSRALRQTESLCFVASIRTNYYVAWAHDNGGKWVEISSSMDTSELLRLFKSLLRDVATVASQVHTLGGGSVKAYLALEAGKRAR